MTLPREVVPGRDYVVTRRCSERRFFLRPDDITDNAFIYCLALAVQRSKVELNFACAMAKHHRIAWKVPDTYSPDSNRFRCLQWLWRC